MKLSYEDFGVTSVLTVSGELTSDKTDNFRRSCMDRFNAGILNFVIDLEHVSLVDSAGLESLLWLSDEASTRRGQLKLVKPDDLVGKILEVTRLDRKFDIHPSIELAAKSLR